MNYKITKGSVGPWTEGTVITDADLAKHPNLGGVARLRDKLEVIEDTDEKPGGEDGDRSPDLATGNPVGPNEVRKLTGGGEATAVDGPNAPGHRRGGKS